MVEKIKSGAKIIAIVIGKNFATPGVEFFTPDSFSQQLGYMARSKGYTIPPHSNKTIDVTVTHTQEVLFIKSGKVKVLLYDDNNNTCIAERILTTGDIIMLAAGGHGFEMIEDTEIIEVKQGPYLGEEDKIRLF